MDSTKVFDDSTWDNVVIEHVALKAIWEFSVKDMKHKDLCAVCSRLKLKWAKNTSKESMLEKIVSVFKLKNSMVGLRMMQSRFSHWSERSPSALIDYSTFYFLICSLKVWHNLVFLEGIHEAFTSPSEINDNLHFEDEVSSDLHNINFKKIVLHDWQKLRRMWKNLNADYKAALSLYIMSGPHSAHFYEFYHSQGDVYYLWKHLEAQPYLNSTVAADLPEEVCINSRGRPSSRLSSTSCTSTKRKGDKSEVIDLLQDMQADCQHKKTKDDRWREKEELLLEREEECKSIEYLKEQERKAR